MRAGANRAGPRRGVAQALVIPASNFSIAWSMVNEGAFWRGGKSANVARNSLPVVEPEGDEVAVVGEVAVPRPRAALTFDGEERHQVVPVEVHLVRPAHGLVASEQLLP